MNIAQLFTQSVVVATRQGATSLGEKYAVPVTVACFVNDARKLVRNTEGNEVVSTTTLYTPLDAADTFAVGSLVTVNGRQAVVLNAFRRDSAGPPSTHHMQIDLT